MTPFADWRQAAEGVRNLRPGRAATRSGWDLPQVLHHCAQSIEYSLDGFPEPKPAWFRATVGPLALAVFDARGRMRHGLDAAIPGAPALAPGQPLEPAIDRLLASMRRFADHTGALAPHFAYGQLDKPRFERAHLMHLNDHWQLVAQDGQR